jgi:predicted nucleic acid-binding protein
MSGERVMVDTNILVYAHDPTDPLKHRTARDLIIDLVIREVMVMSVQVLNEFYVVATRPNKPPALSHAIAQTIIDDLVATTLVLPITAAVTMRALDAVPRHQLAFWDALLWASARENGITTLYTEDLPASNLVEDVRYVNPFAVSP